MARSGRTFHLASRLLPLRMREDAAELYAFCRHMDDLADEQEPSVRARGPEMLQRAIRALDEDPLGEEAVACGWPVDLEARFAGLSRVALRLTQSLAADVGPQRIGTERELTEYAFGVAGTVGIMMCRILGAPPEAAQAATDLGIAMQLTNIARDVAEDLGRDRIYLPAAWVAPKAVEAAIVSGGRSAELERATSRLLELAERYYRSGHSGMQYLPWRARVSILAAAACYREIGIVVGRDIPLSWRKRAVVARSRKAQLLLSALLQSLENSRTQASARRDLLTRLGSKP